MPAVRAALSGGPAAGYKFRILSTATAQSRKHRTILVEGSFAFRMKRIVAA